MAKNAFSIKIDGEIDGKIISKDTIDFKEVMKYLQWSINLLSGSTNYIPVPEIKNGSVDIEYPNVANLTEDQMKFVIDPDLRENNTEKGFKNTILEIEEYAIERPGITITLRSNNTQFEINSNTLYFYKKKLNRLFFKSKGYFSGILSRVNTSKKNLTLNTPEGAIQMSYSDISFANIKENFLEHEVLVYAEYGFDELTLENIPNSYKALTIDFNISKLNTEDMVKYIEDCSEFLKISENKELWNSYHESYE